MTEVIILSFPGVSFPEGGMAGGGGGSILGVLYIPLSVQAQLPCDYPNPKHNCGAV